MAVNSSSSNDSVLHPNLTLGMDCSFMLFAYSTTNILLLLPVCIHVLYLGLQRWRRHRSTSAAATSHSDSFTYHMVAMELMGVFGYTLCCCGIFVDHFNICIVGFFLWNFNWYGEICFQILTCVEPYLAVVHPVTYLSLRRERGIRIRNISIGCVWLLSFVATGLMNVYNTMLYIDASLLIFSLFVISFCSLSVLCVLIRPGPGEEGRDRERVDQSKQRAFYTIMAILVVLLLTCSGKLVGLFIALSIEGVDCVLAISLLWLNLPSSLVLPLLFLHRAGILACRKNNT